MLPLSQKTLTEAVLSMKAALDRQAPGQALETYAQAGLARHGIVEAEILAARASFALPDRTACLGHLDRLHRLAPGTPKVALFCARTYERLNRVDDALRVLRAAAKADPTSVAIAAEIGRCLQLRGEFDEAARVLDRLLRRSLQDPQLCRIAMATQKVTSPRAPILKAMKTAWARRDLPDAGRVQLGFALGKALHDLGEIDEAWACLTVANRLQAKLHPYDRAASQAEAEAFLAAQSRVRPDLMGTSDFAPIFVSGMARSGTTLIESRLAGHGGIDSAGELGASLAEAYRLLTRSGAPRAMGDLSPGDLAAYAARYEALSRRGFDAAGPHVIDKSIKSFLVFGYLFHAFPRARAIVVRRDARDIAISLFRNYFELGTHRYANDFRSIAAEIALYRDAIEHWLGLFPDRILQVRYEHFATDPEAEARRILAFLGLPWEQRVLAPPAIGAVIRTLSVSQARENVHGGRVEAWRRYEKHLGPFLDAWGDRPF
ncbi:MAG: tetratricopeptide repeat-containing sulfotransferase family protein [Roseicyclus sp.]